MKTFELTDKEKELYELKEVLLQEAWSSERMLFNSLRKRFPQVDLTQLAYETNSFVDNDYNTNLIDFFNTIKKELVENHNYKIINKAIYYCNSDGDVAKTESEDYVKKLESKGILIDDIRWQEDFGKKADLIIIDYCLICEDNRNYKKYIEENPSQLFLIVSLGMNYKIDSYELYGRGINNICRIKKDYTDVYPNVFSNPYKLKEYL